MSVDQWAVQDWGSTEASAPGLYLSDIHAGRNGDEMQSFCAALAAIPDEIEWLVLGGDVFDFLVGPNRAAAQAVEPVFATVQAFVSKRPNRKVWWVEGNHDFHLDMLPQELFGGPIVPNGLLVRIGERAVAISHGDIQAADGGYRAMRGLFKSRLARFVAWALPDRLILWGAQLWITSGTHRQVRPDPSYLQAVRQRVPSRVPTEATDLVMGHLHQPIHEVLTRLDGTQLHWHVNGFWPLDQSAVRVAADGLTHLRFDGQQWQESKPDAAEAF